MNILTLVEEYCHYSKHLRGVSDQTIRRYRQNLNVFRKATGIKDTEQLTKKDVLGFFMYGRTERNWSAATFHTYYMSLRVFFRWLKQEGHTREVFVDDMILPRIPRALPKSLTEDETHELLSETYNFPWATEFERARNYAIICTYIFTGIRRSELLNLTKHDLNFQQATLRVNRGKWNKDRVIPMSTMLMGTLKKCLEEKGKMNYKTPHVFCSVRRDQGLSSGGLKKMMTRIKTATGLKIGNHIMRHTFAILMLQGGCDIVSLSRMLGHGDVKTTMKYLLIHDEQLKQQMHKHPLNDVYSGTIHNPDFEGNSKHAQGSKEHQIFRQNQFPQSSASFRNPQPAGIRFFNSDNRGYGNR